MMVFRNWFNEQHSKTTSKKVKAAKRICAENGKYLGTYAPYGFKKDPENHHRLVLDENTSPIIRSIFEMKAKGVSSKQIAFRLNSDGVTSPRAYYYQCVSRKNPKPSYGIWSDSVIKAMLCNEVYIGHLVQFKSGTVSYKNHKCIRKERDEWVRVENTHEAIITQELWEQVHGLLNKQHKSRLRKDGKKNLFSGLLYCADCGYKLRGHSKHLKRADGSEYVRGCYTCGTYARSGAAACTNHYIAESLLISLVVEHIRKHAQMVERDEERIIEAILTAQNNESTSYRAAYQSEAAAHKKQIEKLELLIENLYNDKVTGVVSEDMFKRFAAKYEKERIERLQSVETLTKRIQAIKQNSDNAATWVKLIKQYTQLETLDSEMLLLLIDRIVIGELERIGNNRVRDIKIVYNYVGDVGRLDLEMIKDLNISENKAVPARKAVSHREPGCMGEQFAERTTSRQAL